MGDARADQEFIEPRLEPLAGCQPWHPRIETFHQQQGPCSVCGAVRDERGRVLTLTGIDANGDPIEIQTGIREGDPFVCLACLCVPPSTQRRLPRTLPRRSGARKAAKLARPSQLTAKDRQALALTTAGRAWLAQLDAKNRGESARAAAIANALQLYSLDALTEAELAARAGVDPAQG